MALFFSALLDTLWRRREIGGPPRDDAAGSPATTRLCTSRGAARVRRKGAPACRRRRRNPRRPRPLQARSGGGRARPQGAPSHGAPHPGTARRGDDTGGFESRSLPSAPSRTIRRARSYSRPWSPTTSSSFAVPPWWVWSLPSQSASRGSSARSSPTASHGGRARRVTASQRRASASWRSGCRGSSTCRNRSSSAQRPRRIRGSSSIWSLPTHSTPLPSRTVAIAA